MDIKNDMDLLIRILLDKNAPIAERDDAALDLGSYKSETALQALISIASDPSEEFIADVAGESIAEIWIKFNFMEKLDYEKLIPVARKEAFAVISKNKPEWLKIYNLKI